MVIIIIMQRLTRHIVSVIRMTNRRCVLDVENEKCVITHDHGRPHIGTNGVSLPPGKMDEKLKSENMQKKSSFLCLRYILKAIRAGTCRERRYADHIFIQIYFRVHHFVIKFSKFSSPQAARGH